MLIDKRKRSRQDAQGIKEENAMKERNGRWISILYRRNQMYIMQALRKYGISSSEYPVLLMLYRGDGLTQEDILSYLCLDKSAVARIVQSLEKKELIEKKKDEKDQRCNRVFLTSRGRMMEPIIEDVLNQWNDILMSHMTQEEEEEAGRLLKQMVANVSSKRNEG